jgi:hypothetical protein
MGFGLVVMWWRWVWLIGVVVLSGQAVGGCASDSSGEERGADTSAGADAKGDAYSADAADAVIVNNRCPANDDPKGDEDGDGLRNDLEDRNRNCQVDEGETDPALVDTDGDGLLDGWEDLNRDGITDSGELDPRLADSDGDGTADSAEPLGMICAPSLLEGLQGFVLPDLGVSVALPQRIVLKSRSEGPAALVRGEVGGDEVFGFVIRGEAGSGDVLSEQKQLMEKALRESGLPLDWRSQRAWVTAADEVVGSRAVAAGVLRLTTQASSALSAAQSRDTLVSALLGVSIREEVEEALTYCEVIDVHVVSALHEGGVLVTGGMLVCAQQSADAQGHMEMEALLEDWRSGSMIVPGARTPTGYHCQQQRVALGRGQVDVVWVLDNSASMRDEEERVRGLASALLASLQSSALEWRLGITTTSAYLLDDALLVGELSADEQLSGCSGLRGEGFLEVSDGEGVAAQLEQRLFVDEGCDLREVSAAFSLNANLCGATKESGLLSALTVIKRTDPVSSLCGARARRRGDARTVVFWVSDEDDGLLIDPLTQEPWSKEDPQRHTFTRTISAQLQQAGVWGCAVVGDEGARDGGYCADWVDEYKGGAQDGVAYREVVASLGGVVGSVCQRGDAQALVNGCLGAVTGFGRRYMPAGALIAGSVRVAVDGQVLGRGEGWRVDGATGEVVLSDAIALNERSRVAVAFLRWR